MDPFLAYARAKQKEIIALIRQLVECESPSDSQRRRRSLRRADGRHGRADGQGDAHMSGSSASMDAEFTLPGAKKSGQILALGHSDTVWPMGTLRIHAVPRSGRAGCGDRACWI